MRAFLEVARERSFTRAAAKLGVTRSALSHTIRALEERLGIRLLSRTTRDVAPTAAGQRLSESIEPHFESIAAEIGALGALRDKPSGRGPDRLSGRCDRDGVSADRLSAFLSEYPDIRWSLLSTTASPILSNVSSTPGCGWAKRSREDMVAVRIGPDVRYCVVGRAYYFERHAAPASPAGLTEHNCVNLRLLTSGWLLCLGIREGRP